MSGFVQPINPELKMDVAHNLVVMVEGTVGFLAYFFPVSLGVAGLWLWRLATAVRNTTGRADRVAGWCLLPACLTLGLLVVGTVFAHHGSSPPPAYPGWLILGLVLAHLPLSGVLVWRAGDQWPLVAVSVRRASRGDVGDRGLALATEPGTAPDRCSEFVSNIDRSVRGR